MYTQRTIVSEMPDVRNMLRVYQKTIKQIFTFFEGEINKKSLHILYRTEFGYKSLPHYTNSAINVYRNSCQPLTQNSIRSRTEFGITLDNFCRRSGRIVTELWYNCSLGMYIFECVQYTQTHSRTLLISVVTYWMFE